MTRTTQVRAASVVLMLAVSASVTQRLRCQATPSASVLPASQTTSGTQIAQPANAAQAPAATRVVYADGALSVEATNASLNQILREVAQKTGMKISGGVSDERVFGTYGPAKTAVVLAALLDGTGSNMLLVDDSRGAQLILTPRRGGITPPNPNAAEQSFSADDQTGAAAQPANPYQPLLRPNANGRFAARANPDGSPNFDGPQPPAQTAGTSETAPAQPSSGPSASSTPQQIYDQLQQVMRQKQAAAQTTPQ